MRPYLTALALFFLLAACGGGEASPETTNADGPTTTSEAASTTEDSTETTTTDATTTSVAGTSGSDEFCEAVVREGDEDIDVTNPEEIEEVLNAEFDHLTNLPVAVPEEIADEWAELLEVTERSMALYEEYEYDLFSIPTEELDALAADLQPSQRAILDYCGLDDLIADESDPDDGTTGTTSSEAVPEEAYSPPGVIDTQTEGILTLIRSDAPFDEIVAHYEQVLGESGRAQGEDYVGFSDSMGVPPAYVIGIERREDHVLISISVPES